MIMYILGCCNNSQLYLIRDAVIHIVKQEASFSRAFRADNEQYTVLYTLDTMAGCSASLDAARLYSL